MRIFMYKLIAILILPIITWPTLAATPEVQAGFSPPVDIPDSDRVLASSPNIANISGDEALEIIIGDSKGKVHAYNGDGTLLWQHSTGSAGIESKPVIADLNLDGLMEVIVSAGSTSTGGAVGSVSVLNGQNGSEICRYTPPQFAGAARGVYSSPAIANLDSDPELEITFGDWGAKVSVLNHDCSILWSSQSPPAVTGIQLPPGYDETMVPFTVYVNDTVWSSPAIADINNDGQLDVIIGVDSHVDDNGLTPDGGRLLVINGNNGTLQFAIDTDEVIWSSPVIADLDNDGNLDIIVGTGYCWQTASCAPAGNTHTVINKIYAWNNSGQNLNGWPHTLENTYAVRNNSPAIGDIDGDGFLEVIINTFKKDSGPPTDGKVFAINHDGTLLWAAIPNVAAGQTNHIHYSASAASPIIADITGNGEFDVVVPSNWELIVYDKNGVQISREDPNSGPDDLTLLGTFPFISTPTIADLDNDGDYEIIGASGNVAITPRPATLHVWDLTTSTSAFQPWLSFRNDVRNNGVYTKDLIYASGFE